MIWKKKHQCVVCGLYSRKGEKIHGSFWCLPCEKQMIEDQCKEHEEREYAEWDRISNQYRGFDNEYRI